MKLKATEKVDTSPLSQSPPNSFLRTPQFRDSPNAWGLNFYKVYDKIDLSLFVIYKSLIGSPLRELLNVDLTFDNWMQKC